MRSTAVYLKSTIVLTGLYRCWSSLISEKMMLFIVPINLLKHMGVIVCGFYKCGQIGKNHVCVNNA